MILFGKRKVILIMFYLLAFAIPGKTQDTLKISVDSAINYAVKYNLLLKNAEMKIEESQERVWESISMGLPKIDASVDYSNFMGGEIGITFPGGPPMVIPFNPISNFQVSVAQLIFSGNYYVGMEITKLLKSTTMTLYEKSKQDIIEQVSQTYYMILVAETSKDIVQRTLTNIEEMYEKTESLARVGILEKTDSDQLSVQVLMLENTLKSADRQIELAYNMLRFYLGVDIDVPIKLTQNINEIIETINFESTLINPFSFESNLDFQLVLAQEQILQKQVVLEKMNYLPSLFGFYNHTEKILKPDFDMTPKNVIGLKTSIPVFSSGMRKAKVAQARIRYETGINNTKLLEDQLLLREKQLRFDLRTALDQYESQKKSVSVSKSVYDNISFKYDQGMVSSLDLTTSNNNYLKSEGDYINALIRLLEAELALQKLFNNL